MICFLDLDGVLVDFNQGVLKTFNRTDLPWPAGVRDAHTVLGINKSQFWRRLNQDFWENLEPTKDAAQILALCEAHFGRMNICLLTSPSADPSCLSAKAKWIRRYLPDYKKSFLIGPSKHYCASEKHLLIDDSDKNIRSFWNAGGNAILMPRQWNSQHFITSPIDELKRRLEEKDWKPEKEEINPDEQQISFDF